MTSFGNDTFVCGGMGQEVYARVSRLSVAIIGTGRSANTLFLFMITTDSSLAHSHYQ